MFLNDSERPVVRALAALSTGNPFLPERVENERRALGDAFTPVSDVWHEGTDIDAGNPNVDRLGELAERLTPKLRERLAGGARGSEKDLLAYRGLVFYLLYYRNLETFAGLIESDARGKTATGTVRSYPRFREDVRHFLHLEGVRLPPTEPSHLFAWGYQIRRAFEGAFRGIQGGSLPAARLRAAVWQSVFTRDSERYFRTLFERMGDVTTLILGESGTGKELVARAIGLARYIPFQEASASFAASPSRSFQAVNISALSSTLIDSELFGHRRGAFTGALQDREGWFESCSPLGTVFLDEIGELEGPIQVKLLRVLQARRFQRVGETRDRTFAGKLVAATNRDLRTEIEKGRFREDLYYRLCGDVIRTPTLREQIADSPGELPGLIRLLARRIVGQHDAETLTREVVEFVETELGCDYPWPGNVRELEQCVRNVLIRGEYAPPGLPPRSAGDALLAALSEGAPSADELLRRYCTHVYAATGSYEETGRRLELDWRTVKAKIDAALLQRLRGA